MKNDCQVIESDEGVYEVQMTSHLPPYNHSIYFEIVVVQEVASLTSKRSSDTRYLVVLGCVSAYGIVTTALVVFYFKKAKKKKKQGE